MYTFDSTFQTAILNCVLSDPEFINNYLEVVKPEYFTDKCYQSICQQVLRLYEEHREVPDVRALREECRRQRGGEEIVEALNFALSQDVTARKAVWDRAVDFARVQAINEAIDHTRTRLLPNGSFEDIRTLFNRASSIGDNFKAGTDYGGSIIERFNSYNTPEPGIGLGFPNLDRVLEGGLHFKELSMFIGVPGGGKTTMLLHLGKMASMQGFPVVHYSLELRALRVMRRYDMSFAEMTKQDLIADPTTAARRVHAGVKGKIIVQDYPASSINVNVIRTHLNRINFKNGLIIVDYDELLLPTKHGDDEIYGVKRLYEEIRSLGYDFNSHVSTACQTNKKIFDMGEGEVITGKEAGGLLAAKIGTPDMVISLNQTYKEYQSSSMRLFLVKNREDEGQITETVIIDRTRMVMRPI